MAGRRRRAPSNSTVATVDEAEIQFYKEETVLKPASTRMHTDDWPCFLLADATVYHQDGTIANLLHVDLEGPFITRGRLEIEKDQEQYLVNRHMRDKSHWIQIQSTVSFSIGLKVDDPRMPVLWASGGAGWFEIVPSEAYRDTCDAMFQGICLHFAVLDSYEDALEKLQRKKKNAHKTLEDAKLPLETVLFDYAVSVGDGITLPEAHQRVQEHAVFLLSHFPKGTEFYNTIANKFPDIVQQLSDKKSNPSNPAASQSSHFVAVPYPSTEKSSSIEATESKRGRPSMRSSASAMRTNVIDIDMADLSSDEASREGRASRARRNPPSTLAPTTARDVDVTMLDVPADSSNATPSPGNDHSSVTMSINNQVKLQDTPSKTRVDSDIGSSMSTVLEALQDARQDVLESVKEGKQKKHPDDMNPKTWFNKLYLELSIRNPKALSEVCKYFASDLVPLLGPEWHASQLYEWLEEHVSKKPNFEYITEQDMASITRRKKKQRIRDETRESTGDKVASQQPAARQVAGKRLPGGRRSGQVSGLRPFTGSKKRMRHDANFGEDEMDLDDDDVLNTTSKKSRYFTEDDEDEANASVSSSSEDEENEDEDAPLTRLAIRAEKLPSSTPKGLNQTWTCEEPECGYVVRGADEKEGQVLITEHYEAHEKEAEDEAEPSAGSQSSIIDLAMQESEKGHLPVNHLLDKLRRMGDKAQKREEVIVNGQVLPKPIKRNLLI
ncbi:hypothetical protein GGR52DRAFT_77104 [Hypoxylon sp. FL1284]|nr:hypothetical protein GGR52DRAFT_77104 [Hypoxylon sp. FL1284]